MGRIFEGRVNVTGNIFRGPYKIWDEGNDGSGSGLDADKLDGLDSSQFLTTSSDYGRSGVATDLYEVTTKLTDKYVKKAGDTMTGFLTLNGNPTSNLHASTKQYVDTQVNTRVSKAGDTMTGTLNMGNNPITNIDWANSDDGSGSGLDADTIDGKHLTEIAKTSQNFVDTSSYPIPDAYTDIISTTINVDRDSSLLITSTLDLRPNQDGNTVFGYLKVDGSKVGAEHRLFGGQGASWATVSMTFIQPVSSGSHTVAIAVKCQRPGGTGGACISQSKTISVTAFPR